MFQHITLLGAHRYSLACFLYHYWSCNYLDFESPLLHHVQCSLIIACTHTLCTCNYQHVHTHARYSTGASRLHKYTGRRRSLSVALCLNLIILASSSFSFLKPSSSLSSPHHPHIHHWCHHIFTSDHGHDWDHLARDKSCPYHRPGYLPATLPRYLKVEGYFGDTLAFQILGTRLPILRNCSVLCWISSQHSIRKWV